MKIEFTVPAIPVALPRQRITTIGGHARAYMPTGAPINAFKAQVRMALSQVYHGAPLTGAITLNLMAIFPRPKRLCWKTKPMPRELHTQKPDASNIAKGVEDALNGLAFVDDSQICNLWVTKWFASGAEQAHVVVVIEEIPGFGETNCLAMLPEVQEILRKREVKP